MRWDISDKGFFIIGILTIFTLGACLGKMIEHSQCQHASKLEKQVSTLGTGKNHSTLPK